MYTVFPNNMFFHLKVVYEKIKIILFSLLFILFLPQQLALATIVTSPFSNTTNTTSPNSNTLPQYYDYDDPVSILSANNLDDNQSSNFFNKKINNHDLNENEEMQQIWKNYRKLTINDNCMLCKKLKTQQSETDIVKIERLTTLNRESPLVDKNIDDIARIIAYKTNSLTNFFKDKNANGQLIVAFTFLTFPTSIKDRMPKNLRNNIQCQNNQCALDYIEVLKTNIDNKLIKEYNTIITTEPQPKYLFLNNIQSPTYFKILICWKIQTP